MTYKVLVNNTVVKEYPIMLQAIIYCFMKGYVTSAYKWYFLNDKVKIEEVE